MGIKVILEYSEIRLAAIAGIMRQVENMELGRQVNRGTALECDNHFQLHIDGCIGEQAVAKGIDRYWAGKGKIFGKDVSEYEVRLIGGKNQKLILKEWNKDEDVYILVKRMEDERVFEILGWITCEEGKKVGKKEDPNGQGEAWWVKQEQLHDMDSLPTPEEIRHERSLRKQSATAEEK